MRNGRSMLQIVLYDSDKGWLCHWKYAVSRVSLELWNRQETKEERQLRNHTARSNIHPIQSPPIDEDTPYDPCKVHWAMKHPAKNPFKRTQISDKDLGSPPTYLLLSPHLQRISFLRMSAISCSALCVQILMQSQWRHWYMGLKSRFQGLSTP